MTLQELINYYVSLLVLQYNDKPKALGTIEALADVAVMDMLPISVQNAFSIDTAIGVQLDILGKYAGVVRTGRTFESVITLSDSDFRQLIIIAFAKNYAGSSLYDIQVLLNTFFGSDLLVFDFKNMSMGYFFNSSIGSRNLAEMFVLNDLLPKPMGVQLASLIYSNNVDSFFGFDSYSIFIANNTGFNSYVGYVTTSPWLSYNDAIIV